jgi:uncharacterized protein YggE
MKLRKLGLVVGAGLLAMTAIACDSGNTIIQTAGSTTGISVTGRSSVTGTPDIVTFQLGVSVERPTVEAARDLAARSQQAVIDSLKANGIDEKDIRTVQFTINPQYTFTPTGGQQLRGYQVSNVVNVKLRRVDNASKVLDDVARAGDNNVVVRSISFAIDDPTKLQAEAREAAMKQAKDKAEELAEHGGVKVGRPISINETASQPIPVAAAQAAIAAPRTGDTSTPIQAGDLEIVVTVNVVYAIDD